MFFKTTPKEAPTSGEPIIFLQSTLVACILNLLSGEERLVLMCSSEKSRRFIPVSYGSISPSALEKYQKVLLSKALSALGENASKHEPKDKFDEKKIKQQEIDFFFIFKLGLCLRAGQGEISNCLLNIQWHSFFYEMPRYKQKRMQASRWPTFHSEEQSSCHEDGPCTALKLHSGHSDLHHIMLSRAILLMPTTAQK